MHFDRISRLKTLVTVLWTLARSTLHVLFAATSFLVFVCLFVFNSTFLVWTLRAVSPPRHGRRARPEREPLRPAPPPDPDPLFSSLLIAGCLIAARHTEAICSDWGPVAMEMPGGFSDLPKSDRYRNGGQGMGWSSAGHSRGGTRTACVRTWKGEFWTVANTAG